MHAAKRCATLPTSLLLYAFSLLSGSGIQLYAQSSDALPISPPAALPSIDLSALETNHARLSNQQTGSGSGLASLNIAFLDEEEASVVAKSGEQPWDWSGFGGIAIEVLNPSSQEIWDGLELTDKRGHRVSATGNLAPHATVTYYYPFGPESPLRYGMRGGPVADGTMLPFSVLSPAGPTIDPAAIQSLKLTFDHGTATQNVQLLEISMLPPFHYDGIVDSFGQYTGRNWPGKITTQKDLVRQRVEEESFLTKEARSKELDVYGGWATGPKLPASGFFTTTYRNGRWWFVDPAGRLFFAIGVDGMEALGQTTLIDGRMKMFRSMPETNSPLAKNYGQTSSVQYGPVKQGKTYNFYTANLEQKYETPDWSEPWRRTSLRRLKSWGFNTIGGWSDASFFSYKQMPYVESITIHGQYAGVPSGDNYWGEMPDAFDPRFRQAAEKSIQDVTAKRRNDPWCIGYFVDNELSWGGGGAVGGSGTGSERDHFALAYGALSLGADSPAKQAFLRQLRSHYGDISALNHSWGTTFPSWSALLQQHYIRSEDPQGQVRDDFSAFLTLIGNQYFRIVRDALKRSDPHHLYLGAKFAWRTPEAIAASARYSDVVSFDKYSASLDPKEWEFTSHLNKPCLYAEFHFGALDRGMFHTGLVATANQTERADMYRHYIESVEDLPASIGALWYEYVDEPLTGRTQDGENYSIGFVSITDTPYDELVNEARTVNSNLYRRLSTLSKEPSQNPDGR